MKKQKTHEAITLLSGTIVDGEARMMGDTIELPLEDARFLVASGKAVPKGDDREKGIRRQMETRAKEAAKAAGKK